MGIVDSRRIEIPVCILESPNPSDKTSRAFAAGHQSRCEGGLDTARVGLAQERTDIGSCAAGNRACCVGVRYWGRGLVAVDPPHQPSDELFSVDGSRRIAAVDKAARVLTDESSDVMHAAHIARRVGVRDLAVVYADKTANGVSVILV